MAVNTSQSLRYDSSLGPLFERLWLSEVHNTRSGILQIKRSSRGKGKACTQRKERQETKQSSKFNARGGRTPVDQTENWERPGMKVEDFTIGKDNDGLEYVEYIEGPTKTRNGGLSKKSRDFLPKMYATGDERCPVALFNEYLSRRPAALQNSGPFYLSIKYNSNNNTWYKAQPMGTNRINEMMKRIVQGTQLEHQQQKKLTNHSACKAVVNKLKKNNVERSSIVKVTGHRNLQWLNDYDGDEQEQQQMSSRISWRNNPQQRHDGASTWQKWQCNNSKPFLLISNGKVN
ncbi:zinc finger MYM-type 2-like [Paramuricea clavata]|uniref:Zinc finger MYM-type 2-like n=1 Tax=Paramuricea clavata TaxID=317549 RepID=A0A7D9EG96_PARCT|nr:zinc finger MYM-type 2-like [Paramuricea clavata]